MKLLITKTTLLISLITICLTAFGQSKQADWSITQEVWDGYDYVDTLHATPQQMHRVHRMQLANLLTQDHYYFNSTEKNPIGIRFKSVSSTTNEIYEGAKGVNNAFRSILIEGDCAIEVAALDIAERNADNYRFRVVEDNKKEVVSWTKPSVFKYALDKKTKYAYLGLYLSNAPHDRELRIELYRNNVLIDAVIIGWGMVQPAIVYSGVQYTSKQSVLLDNGLYTRSLEDTMRTVERVGKFTNNKWVEKKRPVKVKDFIETTNVKDIKFRADDSVQVVHFDLYQSTKLYNYKVVLRRDVDGEKDTINLGETNDRFDLYREFWKRPGKYTVAFIPKIRKHGGHQLKIYYSKATEVKFTVLPPLDSQRSIPLKTFVFILLVVLSIAVRTYFYFRRKQKIATQGKEIAVLQLQSLRSQLNPHFIFNALSGVQNLMNKNEVENANKYLARFARLTRNVLDDGQKELIAIEHEVSLLTDYLEMEQMRFGFKFTINVDEGVDQQIEIPAMLLQPFVENAVKHGISALKNKGLITVDINQSENDITLVVSDNGNGFDKNLTPGMGIKLCEERIKLLNSIYKNTSILLQINSTDIGAVITIKLKNWL